MLKVALKVMPRPWASGSKQILIEFFNELILLKHLAQSAAKLWAVKVGNQKKNLDLLGSRLRLSQNYLVNRCSPSDPGSIPDRRKL